MYVGDALVAGKCSKSSTATTLLSENESSPEQPNISHDFLWMCNNVIFKTIDISLIITNSTSELNLPYLALLPKKLEYFG